MESKNDNLNNVFFIIFVTMVITILLMFGISLTNLVNIKSIDKKIDRINKVIKEDQVKKNDNNVKEVPTSNFKIFIYNDPKTNKEYLIAYDKDGEISAITERK